MRSASLATFVVLFALAASAAFAQGCATPQPPVATMQPSAGAGPSCAPVATMQPQMGAGPSCAPVATMQPQMGAWPSSAASTGAGPYYSPYAQSQFGAGQQYSPFIQSQYGAGQQYSPYMQSQFGAGPSYQTQFGTMGTCPTCGAPLMATGQPASFGAGACPGITPSIQASLGAGPSLAGLCGPNFDAAFITQMYQLHTSISALATQGIEQTMDKNLKDLSGKIRYEQTKDNEVLATEYRNMGLGAIPVDYSRVQSVVNTLSTFSGPVFDTQYALEMSTLLGQQRDAAILAQSSTTSPRLRNQAAIVAKSSQDEINALQRWVAQGGAGAGLGGGPYGGYGGIYAPGGNVPIY